MNDKFIKILKFTAYTSIIAASIFVIIKGCIESHKRKTKERLILIAKKLNNDIKNTERRISQPCHQRNQEKYNELWGNESCN